LMSASSSPISVGCIDPVGILYASMTKYLRKSAIATAITAASMLLRHGWRRSGTADGVETSAPGSASSLGRSRVGGDCTGFDRSTEARQDRAGREILIRGSAGEFVLSCITPGGRGHS